MQPVVRFRRRSNETIARWVVLLSPYLFWTVISCSVAGLWLFLV